MAQLHDAAQVAARTNLPGKSLTPQRPQYGRPFADSSNERNGDPRRSWRTTLRRAPADAAAASMASAPHTG
ncbi:hypothetical protein [Streptomyces sp. NPDC059894]|uniref:hypothetical protein n=1 Tax=unclassified Streptomyces TaxID=2593676 RepID=UPI00365DA210